MPTLKDFREYHYDATAKLSDITRTLALSAIAVIWFFKVQTDTIYLMPQELKCPLFLIILTIVLDFSHYLYKSIFWHWSFRRDEKLDSNTEGSINETKERYVSSSNIIPMYILFYSKIIFLIFTYFSLVYALYHIIEWR